MHFHERLLVFIFIRFLAVSFKCFFYFFWSKRPSTRARTVVPLTTYAPDCITDAFVSSAAVAADEIHLSVLATPRLQLPYCQSLVQLYLDAFFWFIMQCFTMCLKCFNVSIFHNVFRCSACAFHICLLNYLLTYFTFAPNALTAAFHPISEQVVQYWREGQPGRVRRLNGLNQYESRKGQ